MEGLIILQKCWKSSNKPADHRHTNIHEQHTLIWCIDDGAVLEFCCTIDLLRPENPIHHHYMICVQLLEPVLLLGKERFAGVDIRVRVKGGGHVAQIYGKQVTFSFNDSFIYVLFSRESNLISPSSFQLSVSPSPKPWLHTIRSVSSRIGFSVETAYTWR